MTKNMRPYARNSRRQFLQFISAAAALEALGRAEIPLSVRQNSSTPGSLSPDAALQELVAGNRRFAANQLRSIEQDLAVLKAHTVDKQEPFAAVLSCADSRVPVELLFDQTIGHIFVARVAGNVVTPEIMARLLTLHSGVYNLATGKITLS